MKLINNDFLKFPTQFKTDFFIIGAPKCGTTSIAYYLDQHDSVAFSTIKEPFYFNRQSPSFNGIKYPNEYMTLFGKDKFNKNKLRGEGSTWYLYSEDAVSNILAHNPRAKFIVCLRNPVEAVFSWFSQVKLIGAETEDSFEIAWELQQKRKLENFKPRVYNCNDGLMYKDMFLLGRQCERLLSNVEKNNVLFIFYEDICNDIANVYADILTFLELPIDGRTNFPIKYERASTKNRVFQSLGASFSYRQRVRMAQLLRLLGIDIYKIYLQLNTEKMEQKPSMNKAMRSRLVQAFSDDIKLLARLSGRNLEQWIK